MTRCKIKIQSQSLFFLIFFAAFIFFNKANAIPSVSASNTPSAPTTIKADTIDGDKISNVLTANGNVELDKGNNKVYADQIIYDKSGGNIKANGNVKANNVEIGKVKAKEAVIKDDFSSGTFTESKMIFNDGSYMTSPQIDRKTPEITVLQKAIYSICPSPEISLNNDLAGEKRDMASIKSKSTTIDRTQNVARLKGATFRFYNFPIFYTPYMKVSLDKNGRQSGFLTPSYVRSTNLGTGIKAPYFIDIAPNMDLTIIPFFSFTSNQVIVNNKFRHMNSYGEYEMNFEIANNKLLANANTANTAVINKTNKKYRWDIYGNGEFDFTNNTGLNFVGDTVGDRNYLRNYYNNFANSTISKVNLDYIQGRTYHAIKAIRFQELENIVTEDAAPFVLPTIDSHIETKPFFFKEKLVLTSNATVITRQDGLQYRRVTFVPEANIPFNLKGNLFNLGSRVQNDFYSLENNFKLIDRSNNFNQTESNTKPEFSASWRMPLINKTKTNTLMFEPMVNIVTSTFTKSYSKLPNEDSNNSELTVSNLFVNDRISGFDRNEAGRRISYGAKTSLFNKYGEFGLTMGQSIRKSSKKQDIIIRGFADNNKSNIVGQAMYKATKYFSTTYSFQLNESNYRNDVNQLTTLLSFSRISFGTDYLLLKKNAQNLNKVEQLSASSSLKVSNDWRVSVAISKDMVLGRVLSRSLTLFRDGCCTTFGFSVVESNPSSLTKPQKTFNLSLSFKNL